MTEIELEGARVVWNDAGNGWMPSALPLRLKQVHGNNVVVDPVSGVEADASVTQRRGVTLAIATADCAPIALSSPEGIVAAVHAGWRGLVADVIGNATVAMRELGATRVVAGLGPCIHAECYEFDGPQLDEMINQFGSQVAAETSLHKRALDMVSAVRSSCEQNDVELAYVDDSCTACDTNYFSYRARKDEGRQLMLVSKI